MSRRLCPDPDATTFLCRACGRPCERNRRGCWKHAKPRCGAMLPLAGEPCARYVGHRYEHRSAYALANAADPTWSHR